MSSRMQQNKQIAESKCDKNGKGRRSSTGPTDAATIPKRSTARTAEPATMVRRSFVQQAAPSARLGTCRSSARRKRKQVNAVVDSVTSTGVRNEGSLKKTKTSGQRSKQAEKRTVEEENYEENHSHPQSIGSAFDSKSSSAVEGVGEPLASKFNCGSPSQKSDGTFDLRSSTPSRYVSQSNQNDNGSSERLAITPNLKENRKSSAIPKERNEREFPDISAIEGKILDTIRRGLDKNQESSENTARIMLSRMGTMQRTLNQMRDEIIALNQVVEDMSSKQPRSRKNEKPNVAVQHFRFVFCRLVEQEVLERSVFGRLSKLIGVESDESYTEKTCLAVQSIMFSKLPDSKKSEFNSKVGKQYCALRRTMVRSALTNAQYDVFNKFKPVCDDVDRDDLKKSIVSSKKQSCKREDDSKKMEKPVWCETDFVQTKHLDYVQKKMETIIESGTKPSKKVKDVTDSDQMREDQAIIISQKLFQRMTFLLTRARERARKVIFEELGFLFTSWRACGVDLDQDRCRFIWNIEEVTAAKCDEDIPNARVVSACYRSDDKIEAEVNSEAWGTIVHSNKGMVFIACYPVCVRTMQSSKGVDDDDQAVTQQTNEGSSTEMDDYDFNAQEDSLALKNGTVDLDVVIDGEQRRIYRAFNLLDVAARFVGSYCGFKSSDDVDKIAMASPESFRVIFAIANLLKEWVVHLIEDFNENRSQSFHSMAAKCSSDRRADEFNLQSLFPSQFRMQQMLCKTCLSLTREEFADDCLGERIQNRFSELDENVEQDSVESDPTEEKNNKTEEVQDGEGCEVDHVDGSMEPTEQDYEDEEDYGIDRL